MRNFKMKRCANTWRWRAAFVVTGLVVVTDLARAAGAEVNIDNFAFTPAELTVKAGTRITFRNRDDIPHSVVGVNAEFHAKALDTDDTFAFTFAKAGTYVYFCGLHPQMKGKIIVTP